MISSNYFKPTVIAVVTVLTFYDQSELALSYMNSAGPNFETYHFNKDSSSSSGRDDILSSEDSTLFQEFEEFFIRNSLGPENLIQCALKENAIYFLLKEYAEQLRKRLVIIERYMDDYEGSSLKGTEHIQMSKTMAQEKAKLAASHPFMSYPMVRRFNKELKTILIDIEMNYEKRILTDISDMSEDVLWPTDTDEEKLVQGLIHIQQVIDADTIKFSEGLLPFLNQNVETNVGLSIDQTFEVGEFAFQRGLLALSIEWMLAAENKMDKYENSQSTLVEIERWQIDEKLNLYSEIHDDLWDLDAIPYNGNYARIPRVPKNPDLFENKISSEAELIKRETVNFKMFKGRLEETKQFLRANFMGLCQGENYQHKRWTVPKLYCSYDKFHPYFTLAPLQTEILHDKPQVIQIHNFIRWSSADDKSVELSEIIRRKGNILKSIEYVTGILGRKSKIHLSVRSIGIDNFDTIQAKGEQLQDNIFRIQLNSELDLIGGEIAFPFLGVVVKPEKGSILITKKVYDINGLRDFNKLVYKKCPIQFGFQYEMSVEIL